MGRAPCCDKAKVKKGPWSPEEDAKLKAFIEEHGTGGNWIALPQKIGLNRCGKSCRLRWLNYLRPNIKHGGFSEEEDRIICSLYISIGSRWSIIAAQLPGRTDNDIKNYWHTKLKKKLLGIRRQRPHSCHLSSTEQDNPKESSNDIDHNKGLQSLSTSALERLQLHLQLQGLHDPFFYDNPFPWPNLLPLNERVFQGQYSNVTNETAVKVPSSTMPSMEPGLLDSMNGDIMESFDGTTSNGHSLPSSSPDFIGEQSNSKLNAVEAELHDLLHGGQEDRRANELDCLKEMDGERERMNWWFDEEKSEMSSWGSSSNLHTDSMLQQYASLYDI